MKRNKINSLNELLQNEFAANKAIIVPNRGITWTYQDLAQHTHSVSTTLSQYGIQSGDVVALAMLNGAEFLSTFLAVMERQAIALPVNPASTIDELKFYIKNSRAKLVIAAKDDTNAQQAAAAMNIPYGQVSLTSDKGPILAINCSAKFTNTCQDTNATATAIIIYTSGTTSQPKAVPLSHLNVTSSITYFSQSFQLTNEDITPVVMPPFHVHGLIGSILSTLYTGGTLILPPKFSASRFWQDVMSYGITWYTASPTIHQILLKRADEDHAPRSILRFIRSSSAKLSPEIINSMEKRYETAVLEAYGMTEAANQVAVNPLPPGIRKLGSVGKATGPEIAIFEQNGIHAVPGLKGEICLRGDSIMDGYRDNPEANKAAFKNDWFATGDEGYMDQDGYLFVTGRIKDLINRGGEKISPAEIESILLEHPQIADAVCFGVPDEKYGEEVHAAVVLESELSSDEIIKYCQKRLSEFKAPKQIHVTQQLPRTATNKIQRDAVALQFIK